MPAQTQPSRLTATVATLVMARGKTPTPAELSAYYDPKQGNQITFLLQEAWKSMPKQAIVAFKAPSSDDSPDFPGQALNTSPLATKNALKRSRDEVSTPLTHMQSTMHKESWQYVHPHNRSCTVHIADTEEQTTAPTRALTSECSMPLDSKHTVTDMLRRSVSHTLLGYLYRQLHPRQPKCWQKPWPKQQAQMLSPLHNQLLEGSLQEQLSIRPSALPDQGRSLGRGQRKNLRGLVMSQPTCMRRQVESLKREMTWNIKPGEHQNKLQWPTAHTVQAQCVHLTAPYGVSNMHTAKGHNSKVYDASMLVADKPTTCIDIRQCPSVTSTHTSMNSYLLASGWSLDAVKWHSTQMAVAVSHLYTSFENMIVPMLPTFEPDFIWIFAGDLYIEHNGLLPSMEVPIPGNRAYTHYAWQDTHGQGCAAASPLVQCNKKFGAAWNTQRSLTVWAKEAGSKSISTLCKVSPAIIGLLIPIAVTSVISLLVAVLDSLS